MNSRLAAVRKAVIPAAGFGTRFLPATKVQPKEMLPIIDTPTIQLVIEEAVAGGITDILVITGKGKHAIEDHFDRSVLLEQELQQRGETEALDQMRRIADMASIHYIRQKEMKGLGDAILHARQHVGNEPFVVLLGDTLIASHTPCTSQMTEIYKRYERPLIGVEQVPRHKVTRYGIVAGRPVEPDVYQLDSLVEKPSVESAPSDLAVGGRYILTPEVFDYLERITPGVGGELQLTDALNLWASEHKIYAYRFEGKRHDIGNRLDYLKCMVEFALARPDLAEDFRAFLKESLQEEQA